MLTELATLQAEIALYQTDRDPARYASISQSLTRLSVEERTQTTEQQQALEQLMVLSATIEPVWGLLAGLLRWESGCQRPHDFSNIWNCARYAGIQSRFSTLSAQTYLAHVETLYNRQQLPHHPAPFIITGNAYRQLQRYAEAETAYLQGLDTCIDDPFLKFRLIDLWLMTYQHNRAQQMLVSLRSRYPQALEMMFAMPVPDDVAGPVNLLPELNSGDSDIVWLVAADPVYLRRYGLPLAQSIAAQIKPEGQAGASTPPPPPMHLHVHVVVEADKTAPTETLDAMAAWVPIHSTQRVLDLRSASANQRSALFASERFLFLAEMLTKYAKPMLVTDIDVECLKDPRELFNDMGDADIGYTRFHTVRDAWDRYPATVLLFKPTEAAIIFCKRLSGMIITLLNSHPEPWFVDQIALFRLIEGGLTPAKFAYLENILTDTDSPKAYFRILHASWEPKE